MPKPVLLLMLILWGLPGAFARVQQPFRTYPPVKSSYVLLKGDSVPAPDRRKQGLSWPTGQHEEGAIGAVDFSLNAVSFAKSRYPGLRGQGVTICLKENAPDATDIDLRGRLLPSALIAPVTTPHATQMATILAGAGLSSPLNEGIAPKARLISANFASLLPESDAFYRANNVAVVNHSYGTVIESFYGAEAVAYDASVYRLPSLLHVFSAGNVGYASSPAGQYAGLPTVATLTGNFKFAKNGVVVGAVDATGSVLASSSRGPAYDGRIKPELVAYSDEGSSGAAALVSGVSALLQQAYRQQATTGAPVAGVPEINASAALLKAVLINSADDAGAPGPDYQTGYGSINAFAALKTIIETRWLEGTVATNGQIDMVIQVPAARQLKVTLVWTDPPATVNSPKALVNNLDLTVTDGHTTYQPWVLSSFPAADSLGKLPTRRRDTLNNAEQVTLAVPAPGTYTVRVRGSHISTGSQAFALAYQWETPNLFYWTTPNAATPVRSDTTLTLRWHNTTAATYGTLEFSSDQGHSWARVRDSVALATGRLVWQTPDAIGTGQLRMRLADSVYRSDSFILSPVPLPTVLYACADSLAIGWITTVGGNPVARHVLYRLATGSDVWEKVGMLTGNRAVLKAVQPGDAWAIAPVAPTGEVGIRSDAFSGQQVFCYYRTVTADLAGRGVVVQCELSTTEGVAAVTYQKQTSRQTMDLGTQPIVPGNLVYMVTDSLLQEGPNTYRVRILLTSGAIIYSDFVTAYALRNSPFLLYPNPVASGQELTIRAAEPGLYQLRFYDQTGRLVGDVSVLGTEGTVSTAGLTGGRYVYAIFRDNVRMQTGSLLVR